MVKVLVTGGSGFIAAHIVDCLLKHGHHVVFTVRSDQKGEKILSNHPAQPKSKLSYVIVKDIAQKGAFDKAVISEPPFEAVLHTASPFNYKVTDPKKDFLDPAILGTTGILKSIKEFAPTVTRVVITSSFAAIINTANHSAIYSEANWNPVKIEEVYNDHSAAYRASKTFAEKAAWEFVDKENPNFSLSTINPPLVFGPIVSYLNNLDSVNTSNQRILHMIRGDFKTVGLPPSGSYTWVDVRDVALAHVKALEIPAAAGKRFFVPAGYFSNGELAQIIKDNFPQFAPRLPENLTSDMPKDIYGFDNSRSRQILGLKYRSLKDSVVDTVKSLEAASAK